MKVLRKGWLDEKLFLSENKKMGDESSERSQVFQEKAQVVNC